MSALAEAATAAAKPALRRAKNDSIRVKLYRPAVHHCLDGWLSFFCSRTAGASHKKSSRWKKTVNSILEKQSIHFLATTRTARTVANQISSLFILLDEFYREDSLFFNTINKWLEKRVFYSFTKWFLKRHFLSSFFIWKN